MRERVVTRLAAGRTIIIGIDGLLGAGKTTLARRLAVALEISHLELDLFLTSGAGAYDERVSAPCVRLAIENLLSRGRPVIVEGVLLLRVLRRIDRTPDLHIHVRPSSVGPNSWEADLLDPEVSLENVLAQCDEFAKAAGCSPTSPSLHHDLARYHKQEAPHERAHLSALLHDPAA